MIIQGPQTYNYKNISIFQESINVTTIIHIDEFDLKYKNKHAGKILLSVTYEPLFAETQNVYEQKINDVKGWGKK